MSNFYSKERRRLRRVLGEIKAIESKLKSDMRSLRRDSNEILFLKGNPLGRKKIPKFFKL